MQWLTHNQGFNDLCPHGLSFGRCVQIDSMQSLPGNLLTHLKAIETDMILSIMDMKKILLCIFFKDLYSPRLGNSLPLFYGS